MEIINVVNSSIDNDILVAEMELERIINCGTIDTATKLFKIKEQLKLIVDTELIKAKWLDYQHINVTK
jgi:hypothetical protein